MTTFLISNDSKALVAMFKDLIRDIKWEPEHIQQAMKTISETLGVKGKPLFMGLRIATTAELHGPSLPNMLALLPKATVLNRLDDTLKLW